MNRIRREIGQTYVNSKVVQLVLPIFLVKIYQVRFIIVFISYISFVAFFCTVFLIGIDKRIIIC